MGHKTEQGKQLLQMGNTFGSKLPRSLPTGKGKSDLNSVSIKEILPIFLGKAQLFLI